MTWIVGTPTMYGYSTAVSDVRVTLANGTEVDCLQKIHRVGPDIAIGFAGSVLIGFTIIENLRQRLQRERDDEAWNPVEVAEQIPKFARAIFSRFDDTERAARCQLMMLSADPVLPDGAIFPQAYLHVFRSPNFEMEDVAPHQLVSIGSGDLNEECVAAIRHYSEDGKGQDVLRQGEVGQIGGMGSSLAMVITHVLQDNQPQFVSGHLHLCWAFRGGVLIRTNNHVRSGRWSNWPRGLTDEPLNLNASDPAAVAFEMPQIATSWPELQAMLDQKGLLARGCVS